jgi:hypothetical protein
MSLPSTRKSSKYQRRLLLLVAVVVLPTLKTANATDARSQPASVANDAHTGAKIPTGFKLERYARVWERNPFTLVTPAAPQVQRSAFDKLFLTSWLKDGRTEEIFIQNLETNEVQRITVEPNKDHLRLIALHLDPNPQFVEAVISDGKEQGPLKFRFEVQSPPGQPAQPVAQLTNNGAVAQATNPPNFQTPALPATAPADQPLTRGVGSGLPRAQMERGPSRAPSGQEIDGQRLLPAKISGQTIPGKS